MLRNMQVLCNLRAVHMDTAMRIQLKLDYIIIHNLHQDTPTMGSFACLLARLFMACGACYITSFLFCLAAALGKKEGCFLMAEKSGAAWYSKIIPIVPLCYFAATYTRSLQCYTSGTSLRTPSSIVLVG